MKCEICQGRGFIEYEHGLIMVSCEFCSGTGGIKESSENLVSIENQTETISEMPVSIKTVRKPRKRKVGR